jgi:hypothetical protein
MIRLLAGFLLISICALTLPSAGLAQERIELLQRAEVQIQHQRLVGNVRAQARREGVVVNTPQLYVYLTDRSAAYHMDGYRPRFERELDLIVKRSRTARSMVRLDRLLDRVKTVDGEPFGVEQLPSADVYLALYRRADCQTCDQVAALLEDWLADNPSVEVVWLDVLLRDP